MEKKVKEQDRRGLGDDWIRKEQSKHERNQGKFNHTIKLMVQRKMEKKGRRTNKLITLAGISVSCLRIALGLGQLSDDDLETILSSPDPAIVFVSTEGFRSRPEVFGDASISD